MVRSSTIFLLAAVAAVLGACVSAEVVSPVHQLTDEDFEHLTQISSGATTGDWFIKFYAPWCGHCKRLAPTWEELAVRVGGELNIASVDCTENQVTCSRFSIRGYPTLIFFHNGDMYTYSGKRDVEALEDFVRGDYKESAGTPAPAAPSAIAKAMASFEQELSKIHWHSDPTINAVLIGLALAGVISIPLIIVFTICMRCCMGSPQPRPRPAKKTDGDSAAAAAADAAGATSTSTDAASRPKRRQVASTN